jgi:hypothetical protein
MKLGKALATGVAQEQQERQDPRVAGVEADVEIQRPEEVQEPRAAAGPDEVPAAR